MSQGRAGARTREVFGDDHDLTADELPVRRTIVIRGQVVDRSHPVSKRPARTMQERAIARPDRVAMWAVMLGLLLVVVAATSGHA
jgi:hypothetical protein